MDLVHVGRRNYRVVDIVIGLFSLAFIVMKQVRDFLVFIGRPVLVAAYNLSMSSLSEFYVPITDF